MFVGFDAGDGAGKKKKSRKRFIILSMFVGFEAGDGAGKKKKSRKRFIILSMFVGFEAKGAGKKDTCYLTN